MRIARFQFNMLPVNTYVLWDTASRECAIVDAGCYYPKEEETLAEFIDDNKLTVKYLLATHLHFDHCFGNSFVAKKYGVILYAAEADEFLLQNMVRQCESFGIPFRGEIQPIGHYISDKDTFDLGHEKLKAIAVPGHSPGSMAFYARCAFPNEHRKNRFAGRESSSVGRIYTNKITHPTERNSSISRSRTGNRDRYRTNRESLFMKGILYFLNHLYDPIKSALTIEWLHAHFSTVATSHSVNR